VCNRVGQQLNQQLSSIPSQVSSDPGKAVSLLQGAANSFRQAAQEASSYPQLQQDLNAAANHTAATATDISQGNFSKVTNTDVPNLNKDNSALNKDCG
jgi:hypothetical protein